MPFERRKSFGDRRGGSSGGFGGRGGSSGGFGGERRWGGSSGGSSGGFGARRSFGESDEPKPVKEGEEHDVTIAEMSRKGDGIARIQNFVVFVAGTQAGDKVRIRIKEVRGRHAIGEVVGEGSKKLDKHDDDEEVVTEAAGEKKGEEGDEEESEEEEESENTELPSTEGEEGAA